MAQARPRQVNADPTYSLSKAQNGEPTRIPATEAQLYHDVTISGTLRNTTGTANDAAFYSDAVQRFLEEYKVEADDEEIVDDDVDGRFLWAYNRLCAPESVVDLVQPTASEINGSQGNTTDFEMRLRVYFTSPYLLEPLQTFLPSFVIPGEGSLLNDGLFIAPTVSSEEQTSGSDAGTGAFFSAGGDDYALDNFHFEVEVEYSPSLTGQRTPRAIRQLRTMGPYTFSAAEELTVRYRNEKRHDLALFRNVYGSDRIVENALDEATFKSSDEEWFEDRPLGAKSGQPKPPAGFLNARAREYHPEWHGNAADTAGHLEGYYPYLAAARGRQRSHFDPVQHVDPRWVFSTLAPNTGTGRVKVLQAVNMGWDRLTQIDPR